MIAAAQGLVERVLCAAHDEVDLSEGLWDSPIA